MCTARGAREGRCGSVRRLQDCVGAYAIYFCCFIFCKFIKSAPLRVLRECAALWRVAAHAVRQEGGPIRGGQEVEEGAAVLDAERALVARHCVVGVVDLDGAEAEVEVAGLQARGGRCVLGRAMWREQGFGGLRTHEHSEWHLWHGPCATGASRAVHYSGGVALGSQAGASALALADIERCHGKVLTK